MPDETPVPRSLRDVAGLTQQAMATALERSTSATVNWDRGAEPSLGVALRWVQACGGDADDLWRWACQVTRRTP